MAQFKILITGGAGFIGYHMTNYLSKLKHEILIIDNFQRGIKDKYLSNLLKLKNVKFKKINLTDNNNLNLEKDFDYIIHLAAIIGVSNVIQKPYETLFNNQKMLNKIINFSKLNKKLKKIIFLSTSEIYAGTLRFGELKFPTKENSKIIIDQNFPYRDSYFLSKLMGEALIKYSNLDYLIFRPHNFIGERMGYSHVIPELYNKIKNEKSPILKVENIDHKRCFCYIGDAVKIMSNLMFNKNLKFNTFNIGNNSEEVTIKKVAYSIAKYLNRDIKITENKINNFSPIRRKPSLSSMQKYIHQYKFLSFEKSLQATLNWYEKN